MDVSVVSRSPSVVSLPVWSATELQKSEQSRSCLHQTTTELQEQELHQYYGKRLLLYIPTKEVLVHTSSDVSIVLFCLQACQRLNVWTALLLLLSVYAAWVASQPPCSGGPPGIPGIPGTHGPNGKQGPKGEKGDPGELTANIKVAFHLWICRSSYSREKAEICLLVHKYEC